MAAEDAGKPGQTPLPSTLLVPKKRQARNTMVPLTQHELPQEFGKVFPSPGKEKEHQWDQGRRFSVTVVMSVVGPIV